jgi:hypothetical protein
MTPAYALALHRLHSDGVGRIRRIPPDQSRPRFSVGGFTVTSGEIEDLDGKIRNLNADITAQTNTSDAASAKVFVDWSEFFVRWEGWRSQHTTVLQQSDVPLLGDPSVGPTFEAFVSEYNERLRAFKASGGQSAATPDTSTESLLDKLTGLAWPLAIAIGAYAAYRIAK